MSQVEQWYSRLSPVQRLKFASLTAIMGAERVARELVDTDDIDTLFENVAQRVYGR
jgi:hypothetical protein